MRGFVREREAEAVRLDEQLEAQELERGALAAKLFKPAGCKYTTPVEGTSLLERIGATSAQIRCLRAEERASVSKLAAARATLCSTVCDVLGERVVPELANDIGCLSAERFQEYQRALAHADDVLARRAQRKGEVLRRLARLRSTLSVDAAERTVETSIRAERSARAERRAVAEGIASRAFAGAVARAAFQSVPILTASADSGSEASAEWTAAPPAPAAPAAAAAERDTLGEDSEGDDGLGFAAATLDRIERCCVELEEEVRVRKEKLLPVGKEIAELWALLSTAEAERVAFKSEHKGLGLVAIDACDAKLAALRAEREERIAELCAARRNAILALWDVLLVRAPSREAASEERAARCVEESRTAPSVAVLGALGALRDALQPRAQCWQTHVVPHLGRWESALADRAALQQMQSDGGATALDFRGRKKFELYEKNLRRLPRIQRALRDGVAEFEAAFGAQLCYESDAGGRMTGAAQVLARVRAESAAMESAEGARENARSNSRSNVSKSTTRARALTRSASERKGTPTRTGGTKGGVKGCAKGGTPRRGGGTPLRKGTPRKGTPRKGTPRQGSPRKGTPRKETPRQGSPRKGTPRGAAKGERGTTPGRRRPRLARSLSSDD